METIAATKLWGINGFIDNVYNHCDAFDDGANHLLILPLAAWLSLVETRPDDAKRNGVRLSAADDVEVLCPYLETIPLIALDIPVYHDGRAYSKAARLKNRYGYQGEIRATGNILIDQISNLLRAGFDTLEIAHELTAKRLADGGTVRFPGYYQPGSGLARTGPARQWRTG
ncbi:DUF934 domain-containing protein [Bartonella sp. LJL80]